jgi:hypothetical protein
MEKPNPSNGTQLEEFKIYIETFRHHFDLFGKGTLAYFMVIGVLCSYLFKTDTNFLTKEFLATFIVIFSLLCSVTCSISHKWVTAVETRANILSSELGMAAFPFTGSKRVVTLVMVSSFILLIAGVILIIGISLGLL